MHASSPAVQGSVAQPAAATVASSTTPAIVARGPFSIVRLAFAIWKSSSRFIRVLASSRARRRVAGLERVGRAGRDVLEHAGHHLAVERARGGGQPPRL